MTSLPKIMNRMPELQRKRMKEHAAAILADERAKGVVAKSGKDKMPSVK